VHVKLRYVAAGAVVLTACITAVLFGDWGMVSGPSNSQPIHQFSARSAPRFTITHELVIPVGRRSISVPILLYHYIRTPPSMVTDRLGYNLSVSPTEFRRQMDWLAVHGYHPVDFNDLRSYFDGSQALPSKPVIITFDDGYRDLYTTAYPILQAHNFKAVAYIVSGFVGHSRYVTGVQVVEMGRNGIEIASHTVNHPDLARTSLPMVTYELLASKVWLQRLVGHSVVDFAYPSGKFNAQVIGALYVTGYKSAVTTMAGTYHSVADRYVWTRIRVGGGESLVEFTESLGPVEKAVQVTDIDLEPPFK
jgi:peptidoglycan/xylan/chitin deacetylase (PgdA/CDA1 family)